MIKSKLSDSVSISELLTMREKGMSNKEIAHQLGTTEATITKYIGPRRSEARNIVTPELKQRMFDLREQGMSDRAIAAELAMTPVTIRRHIGKNPNPCKGGRKEKKVDVQELLRLREQGMTLKQLAEHFGVAHQTIAYHLKKLAAAPSTSPQPTPPESVASEPSTPPAAVPRVITKITDATVREILDLNEKGMSLRKISDQVGINHHQVKSIIKKHAMKPAPSAEPEAQLRPAPSFRERLNAARAVLDEADPHHVEPPRPEPEDEPDLIQDEPFPPTSYSRTPVTPPYSHKWHEVETVYRLIGCSACYLANVSARKVTLTDRKENLIARFTRSELVQYISELERVLWVLDGQQKEEEK